jgi:hypothetical protein
MKLNFVLSAALIVSGSAAFADTLNSGGSAATGTAFSPTGSFWNNVSSDIVNGSNQANVGNLLGDTGAFALNGNMTAGCPTCGVNYMAGGGKMFVNPGNTPDFVSGLNFVRQAGALSISLLYANSGGNGNAEIGIYDQSNPASNHLILVQGATSGNLNGQIGNTYTSGTLFSGGTNMGTYNLSAGSPYANWGIYLRTCEEGSAVTFAQCQTDGAVVTFYMGVGSQLPAQYVPYDTAHQHFALFQSGSNMNQYYAGIEDFAFTSAFPTNPTEGYGDYNDIIIGINTSIGGAVPEPATLSVVGLGLVGLGFLRRRSLKK